MSARRDGYWMCWVRRAFQVFFLLAFIVFMWVAAQGRLRTFRVSLLLDSSPLNALGTMLTAHQVANTMWIGLLVLVLTFIFGRYYCGWICPLGTLFHVTSWLARPRRMKTRMALNRYTRLQVGKYILLAVLLIGAVFGVLTIGLFDPISLMTRVTAVIISPAHRSGWLIIAIMTALLLLNLYKPRFWCRVICPLGALFGLAAKLAPGGIVRDHEACTHCGLCTQSCPGACSPDQTTRVAECYTCWNCVADCPEDALQWEWGPQAVRVETGTGVTRRDMLAGLLGGVATWALYRADLRRGYPLRIRPPGALAESHFLDRCIACGACIRACPTGVLRPALLEAGLAGLSSPVMDMTQGYCELNCTLCGQVCPTGAIEKLTIAQKVGTASHPPVKTGTAVVDRTRCIPWSYGRNCLVCQEVCPVSPKAIFDEEVTVARETDALPLRRPQVIADRCIGCGLCEHECPIQDLPAIRVTAAGESREPDGGFFLQ